MDFVFETRALQDNCLTEQQNGISATNECKISGDTNKCPAGSTITYDGQRQTLDANILCPLDAVGQSGWVDASLKGLCQCDASLLDETCGVIEKEMECECFACPFGMKVGFAYSCTTEIAGPCKSFDCFGKCNGKYDPGNLLVKETFAPATADPTTAPTSAASNDIPNNHLMGTAVMVVTLFRMVL